MIQNAWFVFCLERRDSSLEIYWTGEFNLDGEPITTDYTARARQFDTAADAYNEAARYPVFSRQGQSNYAVLPAPHDWRVGRRFIADEYQNSRDAAA